MLILQAMSIIRTRSFKGVIHMLRKYKNEDLYISDSGVTTSNKKLHISLFVLLCRILSVALGILGVLCFWKGNF